MVASPLVAVLCLLALLVVLFEDGTLREKLLSFLVSGHLFPVMRMNALLIVESFEEGAQMRVLKAPHERS